MTRKDQQLGFDFGVRHGTQSESDGLDRWRAQRAAALAELARRLGVPLGSRVRITLVDGVVLTGVLALDGDELLPPRPDGPPPVLRVDRCTFRLEDVESCVRAD